MWLKKLFSNTNKDLILAFSLDRYLSLTPKNISNFYNESMMYGNSYNLFFFLGYRFLQAWNEPFKLFWEVNEKQVVAFFADCVQASWMLSTFLIKKKSTLSKAFFFFMTSLLLWLSLRDLKKKKSSLRLLRNNQLITVKCSTYFLEGVKAFLVSRRKFNAGNDNTT